MHEFVELVRALAWPAVVLIVLASARAEFTSLLTTLALKIDRASRVKISPRGLELAEAVSRGTVSQPTASAGTREDHLKKFSLLSEEYTLLAIEDDQERVAIRHRLADELGHLALTLKLPRTELAKSQSEGDLVAVATAVLSEPRAGDLPALEAAAKTANFNFTRYRLVLALIPILSKHGLSTNMLRRIETVLDEIEHRPNASTTPSLQRLIDKTREAVADLRG